MTIPTEWEAAADILDPPAEGAAVYHDDPKGFVLECFDWRSLEKGPTDYQLETIGMVPKHGRVAERGPHGLGKTAQAAWLVHWFALTRDALAEDWKAITTASVWRQLDKFLWPEVHKWARLLKWDVIQRRPYREGEELLDMGIKLRTGEASAVASNDPAKIEGAHADQLLYIFDEAKIIPPETFEAAEGAFSGAGDDTDVEAYAIAFSTPGEPVGTFYDIHRSRPGYEDWTALHVTLEQAVKSGRISRSWADQRRKQWGESSAVFQNRVKGEFASSEENTVIPLSWIEAAQERWHHRPDPPAALDAIGADIARSGEDKTVLAFRHGFVCEKLDRYTRQGTMETTGRIKVGLKDGAVAIVDVIGIGAGVVDRLDEQGEEVEAFNASERTERTDSTGDLHFINKRSAAWWNLRELLDPDSKRDPVSLPPDDNLTGDLTSPMWTISSSGKIQVEPKDKIKERLGRSTDDGDAVVQAYWPGEPVEMDQIITYHDPVRIGVDI